MVTYGFFDSIDGDRRYSADDISNFFLKLISNGVFATPANEMQVTATSCMTVKVSPGWGFINCKWIHNDADFYLTLDEPDMILNRADRIILRLDKNTRTIEIAVKKGTPGENAYAPVLQRDDTIWELSLAYIYVWAGHTEITQADIADERGNTDVCGWIKCFIDQIDTTNLFAQYDAAFWIWFDSIKNSSIPNIQERLETAEKLIYPYTFPNIDGNDTLNVLDATLIENFVSGVGIGKYTNDATGWAKFTEENGLPESDYPDANGDGIVNAKESALILDFSANAAVGKYDNSKAGWKKNTYDATKIAMIKLDNDYQETSNIQYFDTIPEIRTALYSDTGNYYKIIIGEKAGIMEIPLRAFDSFSNIISIIIPSSVKSIGNSAFSHCSSLKDVIISDSVETIGNNAFYNCNSLTDVIIPESVKTIGDYAFYSCSGLTDITIPNSVETIGYYTFRGCTDLKNIIIQKPENSISGVSWGASYTVKIIWSE